MAIYTDFDLKMVENPYTKDVIRYEDRDAIKIAIRNILMANFYERRFNLFFGTNIRGYLFENMDIFSFETFKEEITLSLYKFEPRIEELKMEALDYTDNSIYFKMSYKIKNETIPDVFETLIYRTR